MDLMFLALQADRMTSTVLTDVTPKALLMPGILYLLLILAGMISAFYLCDRIRTNPLRWDDCLSRIKNRPWHWKEAAFLTLLLGIVQVIIMWLVMAASKVKASFYYIMQAFGLPAGWLDTKAPDWFFVLIQILFFHVLGLIAIGIMVRRKPGAALNAFGTSRSDMWRQVKIGAVFYLASIPFILFGTIIYQFILFRLGVQPDTQDVIEIFMTSPSGVRVALLFSAIVIAPIFEEALFRGIGLPLFIRQFGAGAAIVMVSAIFAGFHFHLASFLPLFLLAVSFSLAYVYTGSLIVPTVMHALFNGVNLALVILISEKGY